MDIIFMCAKVNCDTAKQFYLVFVIKKTLNYKVTH